MQLCGGKILPAHKREHGFKELRIYLLFFQLAQEAVVCGYQVLDAAALNIEFLFQQAEAFLVLEADDLAVPVEPRRKLLVAVGNKFTASAF